MVTSRGRGDVAAHDFDQTRVAASHDGDLQHLSGDDMVTSRGRGDVAAHDFDHTRVAASHDGDLQHLAGPVAKKQGSASKEKQSSVKKMTVVEACFGGKKMVRTDNTEMLSATVKSIIIEGIAQNTSGSILEPEGGQAPEVIGSPTEKAILSWGLQLGMKFNETRSKSSILQFFPFNSEKNRGGVAVHMGASGVHVYWKGAPELILESCTDWLDADGSKHSMTPEKAGEFKKFIEDMAIASLRRVAFAYRPCEMSDVPNEDQRANWNFPEDNLIMVGIIGIKVSCSSDMSAENIIEKEARYFVERYYNILNKDSSEVQTLYHKSYNRKILNIEEHGTRMSTLFFDNVGGKYDIGSRVEMKSVCVEPVGNYLLVVVECKSGTNCFSQTLFLSKEGFHWVILKDIICFMENSNAENSRNIIGAEVERTVEQSEELNVPNYKVVDEDIEGKTACHLQPRSRKPPKHFSIEGYEVNQAVATLKQQALKPLKLSNVTSCETIQAATLQKKPTPKPLKLSELIYTQMSSVKSKVCIINHPDMLNHRSTTNKDEVPARVRHIMMTLANEGLLKRCDLVKSEMAALEYILAVHDAEYLEFIPNKPLKKSDKVIFKNYIGDVYFSKGTRDAAFLAAGSVVQGCELVLGGLCEVAFAVVRPPGHHALPSFADGFCILNNVAIGAQYLISKGLNKILIVDMDVHHGNGTQEIFYKSNQVMVVSIHSSALKYPYDSEKSMNRKASCFGEDDGVGYNVNISLDKGYTDADMFLVLQSILLPLAAEFKPEMTLISAGYDAAEGDTMGDALLSAECIATFVHKLKLLNTGRVVLSLEGGYNIEITAKCVSYTVRALLGDPEVVVPDSDFYKKGDPRSDTFTKVKEVKAILSNTCWELPKPSCSSSQGTSQEKE